MDAVEKYEECSDSWVLYGYWMQTVRTIDDLTQF